MNALLNICKSTLLACLIFWTLLLSEQRFNFNVLILIAMSLIPIFICCYIIIKLTIQPYFIYGQKIKKNAQTYRHYFSLYALCCFCLCVLGVLMTGSNAITTIFFITAYLTTCQSWVWFFKSESDAKAS